VWRLESARIIGRLMRLVGDVGIAEELAQDAVVAALQQWPNEGIPVNPGGWLMSTAKHRAVDRLRRNETLQRKTEQLSTHARMDQEAAMFSDDEFADVLNEGGVDDDVLRLVFVACHPVLSPEGRTALTLRLVAGLTTAEIARAFLTSESTIAQRMVRAKRTLAAAAVPFQVPGPDERPARLTSVLEVVYLIFNEGYTATAGEEWIRPELAAEALRLGRMLSELDDREAEVHGLVALMEIQASRLNARLDAAGVPVPLLEQNRGRWDRLLIARGFTALLRAHGLGAPPGPYVTQAAIAACHARARTAADTDWSSIIALYDNLQKLTPTPIVELNRAVAIAMRDGPAAALIIVDRLSTQPTLQRYHLLPAVRADILAKLDRTTEARAEYQRAADLTSNERERQTLLRRAAAYSTQ
jgi:RNA polymerase sigma factor (sigma-70 family)